MSTHQSKRIGFNQFQWRLFKSRFFTVSVLAHFIFILIFGGKVLFETAMPPDDITAGDGQLVATDSDPVPKPNPPDVLVDVREQTVPVNVDVSSQASSISQTTNAVADSIVQSPIFDGAIASAPKPAINRLPSTVSAVPVRVEPSSLSSKQLSDIKIFTQGWSRGSVAGPLRQREFEFTAYIAKYSGGDWASTNEVQGGKVVKGSLPNLLFYINKMSRDKIHAKPNAVPLDLASDQIFAQKPPFIFFTGHRDFVLTEQEVANLQRYIRLGGCIWGDASLPGRRSRFDIAFRREMRRVIPDSDKDWESLPLTHPMFSGNVYYPDIREEPKGVNFYREPVYALKYAGEVAVLYTANDYGDMWQIGLDEHNKVDLGRDEYGRWVATNQNLWDKRNTYFRNLDETAVQSSFKFGTNVVLHLLTRWEGRLRNAPAGL